MRFVILAVVVLLQSTAPPAHATEQTLRIGTSGDYPPFSREDGELRGLDIEVARRLARDLGRRLEWVRFGWPDLLPELRKASFDIAMSGVTMRAERALAGRYTRPYASTGAVALIRKIDAERFASADALNDPSRRLAVNAGGHLERVARRLFPRASFRIVTDNLSLPRLVIDGEADAAISDSAEARVFLDARLRVVGPFTSDHKAYLLPQANVDLARRVDAWIVQRERDGWLRERRQAWLGSGAPTEEASAARQAVIAFVRLRLDLMPFVATTKRSKGLPIEDRKQEARVLERVREQSLKPEQNVAVYRVLIDMAKQVQRASAPAVETPSLPTIRDAIQRIDEQLLRELDRLPRSPEAEWLALLATYFSDLPIESSQLNQLAAALSDDETDGRPGPTQPRFPPDSGCVYSTRF